MGYVSSTHRPVGASVGTAELESELGWTVDASSVPTWPESAPEHDQDIEVAATTTRSPPTVPLARTRRAELCEPENLLEGGTLGFMGSCRMTLVILPER